MHRFITTMISSVLLFSNLSAYEATVSFAEKDKFTMDGYNFLKLSESLPILKGKIYDLAEEGEVILAEESYQKLIRITDLATSEFDIFTTRIINNTAKSTIKEITETNRGDNLYYANYDEYGSWYRSLEVSHDIILEDGGLLKLNRLFIDDASNHKLYRQVVDIFPGDQIKILEERAPADDFTNTSFVIEIFRNGEHVGTFGQISGGYSIWRKISVMGIQRKDNFHEGHN